VSSSEPDRRKAGGTPAAVDIPVSAPLRRPVAWRTPKPVRPPQRLAPSGSCSIASLRSPVLIACARRRSVATAVAPRPVEALSEPWPGARQARPTNVGLNAWVVGRPGKVRASVRVGPDRAPAEALRLNVCAHFADSPSTLDGNGQAALASADDAERSPRTDRRWVPGRLPTRWLESAGQARRNSVARDCAIRASFGVSPLPHLSAPLASARRRSHGGQHHVRTAA
jgi:hypothetical protein